MPNNLIVPVMYKLLCNLENCGLKILVLVIPMKKSKGTKKITVFLIVLIYFISYLYLFRSYGHFNIGRKHLSIIPTIATITIEYFIIYLFMIGKIKKKESKLGLRLSLFLIMPVATVAIEEIAWNTNLSALTLPAFLANVLIVMLIMTLIILISGNPSVSYISILLLGELYGIVNYFVYKFRGSPPSLSDLMAAKTALTVASNYSYEISDKIVYSFVLFLLFIILCLILAPNQIIIRHRMRFCLLGGVFLILVGTNVADLVSLKWNGLSWGKSETFETYGAPLVLYEGIKNLKPQKPVDYRIDTIKESMDSYSKKRTDTQILPNVIVIMNESFSDLSVLGENPSYQDYLKNWNDIDEYVMRGFVYVPVYGGGTCNTEFEFLTGYSMNYLNEVPYMNLNLTRKSCMLKAMNEYGYKTVAFHPYYKENWNRIAVYQALGFSEFLGYEEMGEFKSLNNLWCSDESDYSFIEKYIDNNRERFPIFLFNVTMQNHGGYQIELAPDVEHVKPIEKYSTYMDLENYLTLVKESDMAFKELIDYYATYDYPTVICMFGDHQPALDSSFVEEITDISEIGGVEGVVSKYKTPYIIWSNYDIGNHKKDIVDMSTNYLGADLLDVLSIHTNYTDYLLDLQIELPVVNPYGYFTSEGAWYDNSEENGKIKEYNCVQYYELFEKN